MMQSYVLNLCSTVCMKNTESIDGAMAYEESMKGSKVKVQEKEEEEKQCTDITVTFGKLKDLCAGLL